MFFNHRRRGAKEPFGGNNEEPIFKITGGEVIEVRLMGVEGQHLALKVEDKSGKQLKLVSFFAPSEWFNIQVGDRRDLLVQFVKNEWNNNVSIEGKILQIF